MMLATTITTTINTTTTTTTNTNTNADANVQPQPLQQEEEAQEPPKMKRKEQKPKWMRAPTPFEKQRGARLILEAAWLLRPRRGAVVADGSRLKLVVKHSLPVESRLGLTVNPAAAALP
jgi:hypothetical protein